MTLTEIIETWVDDAERMGDGEAVGVVVTEQLQVLLRGEQGVDVPVVAGLPVLAAVEALGGAR